MRDDRRRDTGSYIWSYHNETPSEKKLSAAMRKVGLRFGQEVPAKGFTVDFLVDEWLVIEVDGESHYLSGRAEKDARRQKAIEDAGFTVMRVPAADLGTEGGLKRWVRKIKERADAGPPYLNQEKSVNQDYLRQIEEAKKALRIGEAERKKREALAFGDAGRAGRVGAGQAGSGSREKGESMEDYFGSKAEDFAALLEEREWNRPPGGSWLKDEDEMPSPGSGSGKRRESGPKRGNGRKRY